MTVQDQMLCNSLRISANDLQIGMFIAELDRPWAETPFALQGFLVTEATHLGSLREFVREVTIDPSRSAPASLAHLPWDALHLPIVPTAVQHAGTGDRKRPEPVHATPAPLMSSSPSSPSLLRAIWRDLRQSFLAKPEVPATGQSGQHYLRYAGQAPQDRSSTGHTGILAEPLQKRAVTTELTPPSTPQFTRFIEGLYPDSLGSILDLKETFALWRHRRRASDSRKGAGKVRTPPLRPARERADFLPEKMPLFVYQDQAPLEEEAVRARAIVAQADTILEKLASDIAADLPVSIDTVQPIVAVLVDSVISNPAALMWSARMRDESKKTYMHGLKVAIYMMALGRHLGFPKEQLSELGSIGLLLDIGMLKMPPELLEKTAELTPDETELLIRHVDYSIEALQQNDPLPDFVARGILEHHERIDGSGYPQGLAGAAISVYGKMAAIADTFAAMTTARAYDVTHSAFDAMKELFRQAETKLHGPLVEQFVQAISIFPVGTLIELSSGEVAIVLEHNGVRRLEPTILVLTDPEKTPLPNPYLLELMGTNPDRKKILRGLADGAYGINYRDYYLA